MVRLKSCPRCRGDLVIQREHNIQSAYCLQCGYQNDLQININKNNPSTSGSKRTL